MSKIEKIIFAVIGVGFVLGTVWVILSWMDWQKSDSVIGSRGQSLNYSRAKQAEDPSNPCVPPSGYTEETWREHMSHHPDQYKQCLDK